MAGSSRKKTGTPRKAKQTPTTLVLPEVEVVFVEALVQGGQAARLDESGKLPAGATHKIVDDASKKPTVVRRRFSAY